MTRKKYIKLPLGVSIATKAGTTDVGGMRCEVLMENPKAYFVSVYADHTMLISKPLRPLS